jgi:transposase
MNRYGLKVTNQTLWDQINPLSTLLTPIYNAIGTQALSQSYLHMDFTNWYVTVRKGKKRTHYLTCLSHDQVVYFKIIPRRNKVEVSHLLGDYAGIIISDADKTITSLRKGKSRGVTITVMKEGKKEKIPVQCDYSQGGCWSHARRPFFKAEKLYLPCSDILDAIQSLYKKESEYKLQANGDRTLLKSIREKHRFKDCQPIVDKIYELKDKLKGRLKNDILGHLKKGIDYLENQKSQLCFFLTKPDIDIDNNEAERMIRPSVQGRKNHYSSRSVKGVEAAERFYTIFGTCRKLCINPMEYLLFVCKALMKDKNNIITPIDYIKLMKKQ